MSHSNSNEDLDEGINGYRLPPGMRDAYAPSDTNDPRYADFRFKKSDPNAKLYVDDKWNMWHKIFIIAGKHGLSEGSVVFLRLFGYFVLIDIDADIPPGKDALYKVAFKEDGKTPINYWGRYKADLNCVAKVYLKGEYDESTNQGPAPASASAPAPEPTFMFFLRQKVSSLGKNASPSAQIVSSLHVANIMLEAVKLPKEKDVDPLCVHVIHSIGSFLCGYPNIQFQKNIGCIFMQFGLLYMSSLDREAAKPSFQLDPRANESACDYLRRMGLCIGNESSNVAISTVASILLNSMSRLGDGVNYVTFIIFDILVRSYKHETKKVFETSSARMVLFCAEYIIRRRRELSNGVSNPVPYSTLNAAPAPAAGPAAAAAPTPLPPSKRPRAEVAVVEAEVVAEEDAPTLDAVHAGEAREVVEEPLPNNTPSSGSNVQSVWFTGIL